MWIFKALFNGLLGKDDYDESNAKVDKALKSEENGEDIEPKEFKENS